jgi:hypothetical protein
VGVVVDRELASVYRDLAAARVAFQAAATRVMPTPSLGWFT